MYPSLVRVDPKELECEIIAAIKKNCDVKSLNIMVDAEASVEEHDNEDQYIEDQVGDQDQQVEGTGISLDGISSPGFPIRYSNMIMTEIWK